MKKLSAREIDDISLDAEACLFGSESPSRTELAYETIKLFAEVIRLRLKCGEEIIRRIDTTEEQDEQERIEALNS